MNKYELTVVLNVKLEDEQRAAAIEKVKGYITRFGGTVTNVDEWGKKRLAYEIQKMHEAYYYFIQFESDSVCPLHSCGRPQRAQKPGQRRAVGRFHQLCGL